MDTYTCKNKLAGLTVSICKSLVSQLKKDYFMYMSLSSKNTTNHSCIPTPATSAYLAPTVTALAYLIRSQGNKYFYIQHGDQMLSYDTIPASS